MENISEQHYQIVRITTRFKVMLVFSIFLLNKVIIVLTQANMHQTEK